MTHWPDTLSSMRFDELYILVEVAAAGSLAAAARRLGMPKSTVGRAITRIEKALGVPLVHRSTRGQGLTDQGRMIANLAAPHIAALRDLASSAAHTASDAYGTLRMTAPHDLGALVLAHVVPAFSQRHPGVHVDVELTMRVVDLAREGFDLALRVAPKLPSSTLIAKKLATLDLHLYAGASYAARRGLPTRIEALAEHEHVLFTSRDGRLTVALEGPRGAVRTSLRGRVTCNDFLFARELIASGAGITALPWYVVRSELANGRLVRVLPEYRLASQATVFVLHARQEDPSRKRELFRSFLIEQAPKLFAQ